MLEGNLQLPHVGPHFLTNRAFMRIEAIHLKTENHNMQETQSKSDDHGFMPTSNRQGTSKPPSKKQTTLDSLRASIFGERTETKNTKNHRGPNTTSKFQAFGNLA